MRRCKCCDRPLATMRITHYSMWNEEVCRACYKWARELIYGAMSGDHHLSTPWPHGVYLEVTDAS